MNIMTKHQLQHVVIVGGGFGGLAVARALRKAPVRITLVDRSNHHLFQPLLYQAATATLAPGDIAAPIRHLLRKQRNVTVSTAEVTGVDVANSHTLSSARSDWFSYYAVPLVGFAKIFRWRSMNWCAFAHIP